MVQQDLQIWLLAVSLPSLQVAGLLNKDNFHFPRTLVSQVWAFEQPSAKPEIGNRFWPPAWGCSLVESCSSGFPRVVNWPHSAPGQSQRQFSCFWPAGPERGIFRDISVPAETISFRDSLCFSPAWHWLWIFAFGWWKWNCASEMNWWAPGLL